MHDNIDIEFANRDGEILEKVGTPDNAGSKRFIRSNVHLADTPSGRIVGRLVNGLVHEGNGGMYVKHVTS